LSENAIKAPTFPALRFLDTQKFKKTNQKD